MKGTGRQRASFETQEEYLFIRNHTEGERRKRDGKHLKREIWEGEVLNEKKVLEKD